MKRTNLDALSARYRISDYKELYAKVIDLIESRKIKPVKASGKNGKSPALYREYWVIEEKKDVSRYMDELNYGIAPAISTDYYRTHTGKAWRRAGSGSKVWGAHARNSTEKCWSTKTSAASMRSIRRMRLSRQRKAPGSCRYPCGRGWLWIFLFHKFLIMDLHICFHFLSVPDLRDAHIFCTLSCGEWHLN